MKKKRKLEVEQGKKKCEGAGGSEREQEGAGGSGREDKQEKLLKQKVVLDTHFFGIECCIVP